MLFNDLEELDQTYRPSILNVWIELEKVIGIEIQYTNRKKFTKGVCSGIATHSLTLAQDGSEVIIEVRVETAVTEKGAAHIRSLDVATSLLRTLNVVSSEEPPEDAPLENKPTQKASTTSTAEGQSSEVPSQNTTKSETYTVTSTTWTKPDDTRYSLRGFFGASDTTGLCSLAVVWGRDSFVPVPQVPIQTSVCKSLLGLSPSLQHNMRGHLPRFAGKMIAGTYIDTTVAGKRTVNGTTEAAMAPTKTDHFNAMDEIDETWRIKALGFATVANKLTGLKVIYQNGREVQHGSYSEDTERWTCDVLSDLTTIKLTAGSSEHERTAYIDTVEFVRASSENSLAAWPLDTSTVRFLGESENRVSQDYLETVEDSPKIGHKQYSIRGFFGECSDGVITKLGAIWGSM